MPFWFFCSIFELQKLQIFLLFRGVSSSNCPKFTEIYVFLLILHEFSLPYCTLLFSRKEIINFSEAALVSVDFNCLIGSFVFALGYRTWNIANTTAGICLPPKTAIKTLKQNVKFVETFFDQLFGCPKANFGPMTRIQPHSPDVNYNTISSPT